MDDSVTEGMTGHNGAIEIILVRLEGKVDRLGDRMGAIDREIGAVRQRVHDLANEVTPIVMLDLPGRIRVADSERAAVNARLTALEGIELQRKGAAKLAGALWAVAGAIGAGGLLTLLKMVGVQ